MTPASSRPVFAGAGYLGCFGPSPLFPRGSDDRIIIHEADPVPISEPRRCVVENPVPLAFDPDDAVRHNDAKEHEGVSFRRLWENPLARTIWLGHKRFMITSQYFRGRCIDAADWLEKHPERLLEERVWFQVEHAMLWASPFFYEVGAQLVPYLIYHLQRRGKWPYFSLPCEPLRWKIIKPEPKEDFFVSWHQGKHV